MITVLLIIAACVAAGYFLVHYLDCVFKKQTSFFRETKEVAAVVFGFGGFFAAVVLNEQLCGLIPPTSYEEAERVYFSPVEDSVFIAINKKTIFVKPDGKREVEIVQFLMGDKLLEIGMDKFFKKNVVFLPEDDMRGAWIQKMKPVRNDILRFFVTYSDEDKIFISPSGIRRGKIETIETIETHRFIPYK